MGNNRIAILADMEELKNIIKHIPGSHEVARLLREPRAEIRRWREFLLFKKRYQNIFNQPQQVSEKGRVLVVGLLGSGVSIFKQESLLAKAYDLQGFKPIILTNRGAWFSRYYRALGINQFIYLENYIRRAKKKVRTQEVGQRFAQIRSFQDLIDCEYEGIKIGKHICSSLVRDTHSGSIDVNDQNMQQRIQDYLFNAVAYVLAAKEIYDAYKPDATLFLERGYTLFGEFFDFSLQRGINTIQWVGSYKENAISLKRYYLGTEDSHPISLSRQTWKLLERLDLSEERKREVKEELFHNYSSGKWFSEMGAQSRTTIVEKQEIQKILGLDPIKKTAVIFSPLFWDATFFWGKDLFPDFQEWFVQTVKAACANNNLNWIIKLHPANVVKLHRDKYEGELIEKRVLRENIGELPPHIKILEPDTPIATYSLYSLMDYCITVRGTVGIEAAFFGIPVFTAGTGRYDQLGFTIDFSNQEEYLEKISHIQTYPPLTPGQTELAQKFAYGLFVLRPFLFKNLRIAYKKDQEVTPDVEYLFSSKEQVLKAEDLRAFGDWAVHSRDEDYLDRGKIRKIELPS